MSKFPSQYNCDRVRTAASRGDVFQDVYKEVLPGSYDLKTGKILNKSSHSEFVKVGKVDVNAKIQSYADECDVYKILERFAITQDPTLLNQRVGNFLDITKIPDNYNDFANMMNKYWAEVGKMDKDVAKALFNEKMSVDAISKLIDEKIQAAIAAKNKDTGGTE